MANISNLILQSTPHQKNALPYQDFELDIAPSSLLQLMTSYQLKTINVIGSYSFNSQIFAQLVDVPPYNGEGVTPASMYQVISHWPENLNWSQLNHHIQELMSAWILDYKAGAKLDSAFLLLRCLALQSTKNHELVETSASQSNKPQLNNDSIVQLKFQSLLMQLLARVTNQFDQYKFSYAQNFDLDSGLPNQQLLMHFLEQHLQKNTDRTIASSEPANTESSHLGLILINFNIDFVALSHHNTNPSSLMREAIQAIQMQLHESTKMFHVGPIDLAILINDLTYPAQLNLIISKLMHEFESTLPLINKSIILAPYFGAISTFSKSSNAISLYENARLALHEAIIKNERFRVYDQNMSSSFTDSNLLDKAIIDALQQNELEIYLQPIVTLAYDIDTKDHCITAEALLRWPNKDFKSISPIRLIDTIYKNGFGKVFIRWLINNACQRCAELMLTHQRRVMFTINLCAADLLDEDLPELLAQSIALWEIPAQNLVMEVTESDVLINEVKVARVIANIEKLGFKFALDDFGTGYSSMARLRSMPVDIVKIDQSFVRNIATSVEDKNIVLSVVKLAHSLGKEVVAEGVEDLACLNVLKEMKCNKIQGYYYAKPMPFNEFVTWLNDFESKNQAY